MNPEKKQELWGIFKNFGQAVLGYNHYDLASMTSEKDTEVWKQFLNELDVKEWIESELQIMQSTELTKLLADIGSSNSVGKAQLIGALSKLNEKSDSKEGPIIIYTYVPLNAQEEHAPNVQFLDEDIFMKE